MDIIERIKLNAEEICNLCKLAENFDAIYDDEFEDEDENETQSDSSIAIDGDKVIFTDGILKIFSHIEIITRYIDAQTDKPISLNDCLKFINQSGVITVIYDQATNGVIYQWGKHGDIWEEVGATIGYA